MKHAGHLQHASSSFQPSFIPQPSPTATFLHFSSCHNHQHAVAHTNTFHQASNNPTMTACEGSHFQLPTFHMQPMHTNIKPQPNVKTTAAWKSIKHPVMLYSPSLHV
ncbi:hypothetical protein V8G54_024322 [Vigna mungo]|uniref:Uncharacterized protein n=1 Tax=Vigna mungo TaxID=3915 RepID=A0AAQ3N722_VIGMU